MLQVVSIHQKFCLAVYENMSRYNNNVFGDLGPFWAVLGGFLNGRTGEYADMTSEIRSYERTYGGTFKILRAEGKRIKALSYK